MAFRRKQDAAAPEPAATRERPRAESTATREQPRWQSLESAFARIVMTMGVVGIGTALAAILGSQDVDAWIVGLVVSLVSVVLAALLWSRYRA